MARRRPSRGAEQGHGGLPILHGVARWFLTACASAGDPAGAAGGDPACLHERRLKVVVYAGAKWTTAGLPHLSLRAQRQVASSPASRSSGLRVVGWSRTARLEASNMDLDSFRFHSICFARA
nr:unnamed protein product [Digitaria exilis]